MISEVSDLINLPYFLNVCGQTGQKNSVDADQRPQNAASDQCLNCLPLTQQFCIHSQILLHKKQCRTLLTAVH